MFDARHFGAEQRDRRRLARLEEAKSNTPARSVRSIRQQFETPPSTPSKNVTVTTSASAPVTPAKKTRPGKEKDTNIRKQQTYSEAELRAFIKGRTSTGDKKSKKVNSRKTHRGSADDAGGTVGSLIEKWGGKKEDRAPLVERDLQKFDIPKPAQPPRKITEDSVDTFGSATTEYDHSIPKTDPGPRPPPIHEPNKVIEQVPMPNTAGNLDLKSLVARGIQNQSAKKTRPQSEDEQKPTSAAEMHVEKHTQPSATVQENVSDWGAGDAYIRELFAEAEETAEKAVMYDENEEYFEAFELYWVVVDLYYKVIPFLSQEEGEDVHERIKMYTRRCGQIREAFEDDPEGQEQLAGCINDAAKFSAKREEQIQESFNAGMWNHARGVPVNNVKHAQAISQYSSSQPISQNSPTSIEDMASDVQRSNEKMDTSHHIPEGDLQRNRYPDYKNTKPLDAIPEAPQNTSLSASTKAHRSSLSRPISRNAIRESSIPKERVEEMQERVNVMQQCLNNFTVKRKHLGPARALELLVTTLNANTFGDLKKLEPLPPHLEHKWATELEVLLSLLKEIKELRPGVGYVLREDIDNFLPALEKFDRTVRSTVQSFAALEGHVKYVERETATASAKNGRSRRRWWVKMPVVAKGGLPKNVLKIVKEAEVNMRGVFKVCHEINVEVVKSMPVPQSFVDGLPRHARTLIPRELKEGLTTWTMFKVSDYMKDRNLWTKDAAKEITSSLEKVALIWEAKASNKSIISRTLDFRGERFQQAVTAFRRCQTAIRDLRRDW